MLALVLGYMVDPKRLPFENAALHLRYTPFVTLWLEAFVLRPSSPEVSRCPGAGGTVDSRDGFSIVDIPLGRYRVEASLLEPNGSYTPLAIQAYRNDRLTNDNIITFDEGANLSCDAVAKHSVIVLSTLE